MKPRSKTLRELDEQIRSLEQDPPLNRALRAMFKAQGTPTQIRLALTHPEVRMRTVNPLAERAAVLDTANPVEVVCQSFDGFEVAASMLLTEPDSGAYSHMRERLARLASEARYEPETRAIRKPNSEPLGSTQAGRILRLGLLPDSGHRRTNANAARSHQCAQRSSLRSHLPRSAHRLDHPRRRDIRRQMGTSTRLEAARSQNQRKRSRDPNVDHSDQHWSDFRPAPEARGQQSLWETMSSLWSVGERGKPNGSLVDLDSPSFGVWLPTIAHVSADERLLSAFRRLCCVVGLDREQTRRPTASLI